MDRRSALLTLVALGVAPRIAGAQQKQRVGLVISSSPVDTMTGPNPSHPFVRAFVHELRDRGYI